MTDYDFSSAGAPAPQGFEPQGHPQTPKGPRRQGRSGGAKAAICGAIGGVVSSAALVAALVGTGVIGTNTTTVVNGASTTASQPASITVSGDDVTLANAVSSKVLPSVVSIYVTSASGSGMGSGSILDTEGHIITNNHVIEGAQQITVTIEGKSYNATLVGTDASSDLAVIKADLQGAEVTPIQVGDSSELAVGDWVMTVGSPFGLEQSVSQGIVSALYRSELMQSATGNTLYTNLIQVDAAINPGNSGGALVNAEGELVGISTLYSSSTQSFAGIGFAIPGNYAIEIANKIISGQPVTHAYLGVSMQTVNAQNAAANGLSVNQGAYVAAVSEDSPASAAGIQAGDIITKIGDTEIASSDQAILAVRSHSIGEEVTVTVVRGSEELSFDVSLGSDEPLQEQQADLRHQQQNEYYQNQQNTGR